MTELKNSIERFNSRQPNRKIGKLEDRAIEIIQCEEQKEKRMKKDEESL